MSQEKRNELEMVDETKRKRKNGGIIKSILLLLIMSITFCACGEETNNENTDVIGNELEENVIEKPLASDTPKKDVIIDTITAEELEEKSLLSKQGVYQKTELLADELNVENKSIMSITYWGNRLYLFVCECVPNPEDPNISSYKYYLVSSNDDGSDKKIHLETQELMPAAWLGEDGSFMYLYEKHVSYELKFFAEYYDNEGNLLWKKEIPSGPDRWMNTILQLEPGVFLVASTYDGKSVMLDNTGNEISTKTYEKFNCGMYSHYNNNTSTLVSLKDNDWSINTQTFTANTLNINTGEYKEQIETPDWLNMYEVFPGYTTDFLLCDSLGVYTYNLGDSEPTKIMDYINSDFIVERVNDIRFINEQEFIMLYYDKGFNEKIAKFSYVAPENIQSKQTLVLGLDYIDGEVDEEGYYNMKKVIADSIKREVVEFNKSSSEYRIVVQNYNCSGSNSYRLQEKEDMLLEQFPDIMLIDAKQDISAWVKRGLLTDIGDLISRDPELSNLEYLDNVWSACSINNTLYSVIPSFQVKTMLARKDMVGDIESWGIMEFIQYMESLPEDIMPFGEEMMREDFLNYIMDFLGRDFVDIETDKCCFDSPEFIALLEYASTIPQKTADEEEDIDKKYMTADVADMIQLIESGLYRDKKAVLLTGNVYSIQSLVYDIHGELGTEASFVGFPGINNSNASVIIPDGNIYVISSDCKSMKGAWEFVRKSLTEEGQSQIGNMAVLKSVFEEQAKESMELPYYIHYATGEKEEYEYIHTIKGEEIVLAPFSQEEVNTICDFIYSVDKSIYGNEDVINMVKKEAQYFFDGERTAQEVA